jgi:hypothetical protein
MKSLQEAAGTPKVIIPRKAPFRGKVRKKDLYFVSN